MANRLKGEHAVTCSDGVERTLVFDVNAFCDIEERLDVRLAEIGGRLASPSARDLRALFHIGLQARHPEFDEKEAARLADLKTMADSIGAALRAAMPQAEAGAEGGADPRGAAGGTGSSS